MIHEPVAAARPTTTHTTTTKVASTSRGREEPPQHLQHQRTIEHGEEEDLAQRSLPATTAGQGKKNIRLQSAAPPNSLATTAGRGQRNTIPDL
jgi:hypothetical protein